MAKKRQVGMPVSVPGDAGQRKTRPQFAAADADPLPGVQPRKFDPLSIALGLLGGAIVYVSYFPSDSVSVEKGDALWFGFLAIAIATITLGCRFRWTRLRPMAGDHGVTGDAKADPVAGSWPSILLDLAPWLLAAWMMLGAFLTSPPGNLRMATNEGWLWVSAAALFTAARRLFESLPARQSILLLLIVCASGLSVHGLHQYFISLPENRAQYQRDPERILQLAGIEAPPGSAERMVFENRLFDGGPTGTFALANSLAAALLVGGIGALGVLRFRWSSLTMLARILWAITFLLCAACLMATRSRSATLAMLLGIGLLLVVGSRLRAERPRMVWVGLLSIAAIGIAGAFVLAVFGNPEWFEEAPASLAFRFQYWRSTWQLALDRPLFGAGPGNFQSIYERYREASATEQIAEPHNFIFETLAGGGFVAVGLLTVWLASGIVFTSSRWTRSWAERDVFPSSRPDSESRWVWLGAGLGLLMVWLIGFATRFTPDFDAHLFAVPTAILLAIMLWPSARELTSRNIDSIALAAVSALMIHLLVAGGWTVPGVAILAWLLCALLTRTSATDSSPDPAARIAAWGAVSLGLFLLTTIYLMSLNPVALNARAMSVAEYSQAGGQIGRVRASLRKAMAADPWSAEATLWTADVYRWQLVLADDSPAVRQSWEEALSEAKRRAGDDPAVYRIIGAQQLHLYQRFGQQRDLEAAAETFRLAVKWSPSNQWMIAQLAVIEAARGHSDRASADGQACAGLIPAGGQYCTSP